MLAPRHFFAVIAINAVFAGAYIAGKIGVDNLPPFLFTTLRFALVFVALLPFFRWRFHLPPQQWRVFWSFCFAMGIGVYSTMYLALYYADGVAAILIGTQFSVPIAAVLGIILLGDRVAPAVWFGIGLAFVGVMAVGVDTSLLGYWQSFLLILASAFFYALSGVLTQKLKGDVNLLNLNAWMSLVAIPPMFVLSLLFEDAHWTAITTLAWEGWAALLYSSLAVSLVGHIGMFALLRHYPVSQIMPFYVLMPIFGILVGLALFDEQLTVQFAIGASVALTGVWIVNRHHRRGAVKK